MLKSNFFATTKTCSIEKLNSLCKKIQSYTVIGPPSTWHQETLKSVGSLVAGLDTNQIREIRPQFFSAITPSIIRIIPIEVLKVIYIPKFVKLYQFLKHLFI